jgi:hypothetical protein
MKKLLSVVFAVALVMLAARVSLARDAGPIIDTDGDHWIDSHDNCPSVANPDQKDTDGDGKGDACDHPVYQIVITPHILPPDILKDTDSDGVFNIYDNCPLTANTDQANMDGDELGDVCDDSDYDGVMDSTDNCPVVANTDQADSDGDGMGDVCEAADTTDSDGDGVIDADDECPTEVGTVENAGCPEEDLDLNDTLPAESGYSEGGCSMLPGAASNPIAFVMLAMALIPLARKRK